MFSGLAFLQPTVTYKHYLENVILSLSGWTCDFRHYSDKNAKNNVTSDLLPEWSPNEYCDYNYAHHADRQAETGSKRLEDKSCSKKSERWQEDYGSLMAHGPTHRVTPPYSRSETQTNMPTHCLTWRMTQWQWMCTMCTMPGHNKSHTKLCFSVLF